MNGSKRFRVSNTDLQWNCSDQVYTSIKFDNIETMNNFSVSCSCIQSCGTDLIQVPIHEPNDLDLSSQVTKVQGLSGNVRNLTE